MIKSISARLERLECEMKAKLENIYPDDSDGFIYALVGDKQDLFRKGNGFDVAAALNYTAVADWSDEDLTE